MKFTTKFITLCLLLCLGMTVTYGQQKQIIKPKKEGLPYPFSPGVVSNGFLFVSGQVGSDPQTGKVVPGGIEAETMQTFNNIKAVLEGAGATYDDVVSVTVYLTNMDDFPKMNAVYKSYFKEGAYPARTTVGVAKLVLGASVEMTMTVAMPGKTR